MPEKQTPESSSLQYRIRLNSEKGWLSLWAM